MNTSTQPTRSGHCTSAIACALKALSRLLLLCALWVLSQATATAQNYGPTAFYHDSQSSGAIAGWQGTSNYTDPYGNDYGDVDFYHIPGWYIPGLEAYYELSAFIDATGALWVEDPENPINVGGELSGNYVGRAVYDANNDSFLQDGNYPNNGLVVFSNSSPGIFAVAPPQTAITSISDGSAANLPLYYWVAYDSSDSQYHTFTAFLGTATLTNFQLVGSDYSPYYRYDGGRLFLDGRSTWPASNIFFGHPPHDVYVGDGHFVISGMEYTWSSQSYSETITYSDPTTGNYGATIHRSYDGSVYAGDISGTAFSGTFDPISWWVSNLSGAAFITFGAPSGTPTHGPPFISWDGHLLNFLYTDPAGGDVYWNEATGKLAKIGSDNFAYLNSTPPATSYLDPVAWTFAGFDNSPGVVFALDANGNAIGLPAGVAINVGYQDFATSVLASDGQYYFPYSYQKPDGSWVAKFTGIPEGLFFLISDNVGNYNSQIYFSTSEDRVINAINGWPLSNAYPSQIYINGVLRSIQWDTHYEGGSAIWTYGGVSYGAPDGPAEAILSWTWDNGPVWTWSMGGNPVAWDGGNTFGNFPPGMLLSFDAPPGAPSFGPPRIVWNGAELEFSGLASQLTGSDIFTGDGMQLAIGPDHSATVYDTNTGQVQYSGTYNPALHTFNFGTANFGTASTFNSSGNLLATSTGFTNLGSIAGDLDIRGNHLSLGTWLDGSGSSVNGFSLAFMPPSTLGGVGTLQFGSTVSLTDWLWSHAVTDGAAEHNTAMKLDSANRLMLFDPANPTAPPGIVLDPAGPSRFKGPVRIDPQGDISMGIYGSSPAP